MCPHAICRPKLRNAPALRGYAPLVDDEVVANDRLTAVASAVLLALLAVELATTLRVAASMPLHIFVGVLLAGPLVVKLASTGARFLRYYLGSAAFVRKGPPRLTLRILALLLIALTLGLVASGFGLLYAGPDDPGPFLAAHNITFVFWLPVFAVHAVAHLRRLPRVLLAAWTAPAQALRSTAIDLTLGALVFGAIAALALLPTAGPWAAAPELTQMLPAPVVVGTALTLVALLLVRPLRWTVGNE